MNMTTSAVPNGGSALHEGGSSTSGGGYQGASTFQRSKIKVSAAVTEFALYDRSKRDHDDNDCGTPRDKPACDYSVSLVLDL